MRSRVVLLTFLAGCASETAADPDPGSVSDSASVSDSGSVSDSVSASDSSPDARADSTADASTRPDAATDAVTDAVVDAKDAPDAITSGAIVMGMYNNTAVPPGKEVNTAKNFRTIADKWFVGAKMKVHRVFDPDLPSSYATSAGADDPANGNVSFLSVKPPTIAGVAAGTYDAAIESLAKSMPAGSYFTMFHEPEDNMDGKTFVTMFRHFYTVAKKANVSLSIGYVAMSYQWRPGSPSTATPDDWWPGDAYTDWLGVDAYVSGWEKTAYSLDVDPQFQRWYSWAKPKGKPLILPEWGIEAESTGGFTDKVRADAMKKSMEWVATRPEIRLVLWWNGTSSTPGGQDHTLDPTTSQPSDLYPLARAAWNEAVTKYGATATTF
jgi:hypothetical protein